ncbi:MAG: hypothetical protein K6F92_08545 [Lachnospiraceae bacterium]|nr:hypothetical protein [Lachnospiraceae bacterium]
MRMMDRLRVARWNLRAGSKMAWKMVFGLSFIFMLVICFTTIYISYVGYVNDYNENHLNDCYMYQSDWDCPVDELDYEAVLTNAAETAAKNNAACFSVMLNFELKSDEEYYEGSDAGHIVLRIDDETYGYVGVKDPISKGYRDLGKKCSVMYGGYREGFNVFPELVCGKTDSFLVGEYPSQPGEIMVDRYFLQTYGINDEPQDVIGHKLSIMVEDGQRMVFEDYVISGVFDDEVLGIRETGFWLNCYIQHVYANILEEDEAEFSIYDISSRYYYRDYGEYAQNCRYIEKLLHMEFEFADASFGELELTQGGMMYCVINQVMQKVGMLILLILGSVSVIIVCSIVYIWYFYRKRGENYQRMLSDIGMRRRDRSAVTGLEIFFILLRATFFGVYFSVIFMLLFATIIRRLMIFTLVLPLLEILVAVAGCWLFIYAILLVSDRIRG